MNTLRKKITLNNFSIMMYVAGLQVIAANRPKSVLFQLVLKIMIN